MMPNREEMSTTARLASLGFSHRKTRKDGYQRISDGEGRVVAYLDFAGANELCRAVERFYAIAPEPIRDRACPCHGSPRDPDAERDARMEEERG
jgi:hypothetical protein